MATVSTLSRTACAALLALLLGFRLLSPAGFMPAFERGTVTIVACPDADAGIAAGHRNHPADHKTLHQPCPYAAASSLGALQDGWPPLLTLPGFAILLTLGESVVFEERRRANERPHPTGPPLPA